MYISGSTWSWGTGPSTDHTIGTTDGYFIYLESSYPRIEGDIARIHSPWLVTSGSDCSLKFWFHMFGVHIGNLNVSSDNHNSEMTATNYFQGHDQMK